jgi:hypothetical protein
MVFAQIGCHAVKPGREGGLSPESLQFPEDLQKKVLSKIFGVGGVSQHSVGEVVHALFVSIHDDLKGGLVPGQKGLDYLLDALF